MPGRVRPSRNSREAPPPVEMWSMASDAGRLDGGQRVAAADDSEGVGVSDTASNPQVPCAKPVARRRPWGRSRRRSPRCDHLAVALDGLGPMSKIALVLRHVFEFEPRCVWPAVERRRQPRHRAAQAERLPSALLRTSRRASFTRSGSARDDADFVSLRQGARCSPCPRRGAAHQPCRASDPITPSLSETFAPPGWQRKAAQGPCSRPRKSASTRCCRSRPA